MFDHFKYDFFQLITKLSIFTLLIAFFAYFSIDTLQLLSNSGNQYAVEVYEFDGGEDEKNNESEDEVKEIDDFLFTHNPKANNYKLPYLGRIFSFDRYQNFKKEVDSPPPLV